MFFFRSDLISFQLEHRSIHFVAFRSLECDNENKSTFTMNFRESYAASICHFIHLSFTLPLGLCGVHVLLFFSYSLDSSNFHFTFVFRQNIPVQYWAHRKNITNEPIVNYDLAQIWKHQCKPNKWLKKKLFVLNLYAKLYPLAHEPWPIFPLPLQHTHSF